MNAIVTEILWEQHVYFTTLRRKIVRMSSNFQNPSIFPFFIRDAENTESEDTLTQLSEILRVLIFFSWTKIEKNRIMHLSGISSN